MSKYRTKAGLILEKLLNESKYRWLWCWKGDDDPSAYDCACCIMWPNDNVLSECECICHTRIEEIASLTSIRMWLLAAEGAGELPKFFTSYRDKLIYCKEIASKHYSMDYPCPCEFCKFANDDAKTRKFPLDGEDNSNVDEYRCHVCNELFRPNKEMMLMICPKCESKVPSTIVKEE